MKIHLIVSMAILADFPSTAISGKPLKVFILAGQSNMQGKARVRTIANAEEKNNGCEPTEGPLRSEPNLSPGSGQELD